MVQAVKYSSARVASTRFIRNCTRQLGCNASRLLLLLLLQLLLLLLLRELQCLSQA
jgi:hypothetical protein